VCVTRTSPSCRPRAYSILRDWIKGQITAVEYGILSFEGAFLGQIMLSSGEMVMEHIEGQQFLAIAPPTHECGTLERLFSLATTGRVGPCLV
jgi:hypothetical protein